MKTILLITGLFLCLAAKAQQTPTKRFHLILEESSAQPTCENHSYDETFQKLFPIDPAAADPAFFESTEKNSFLTQSSFKNSPNKTNYNAFITAGVFGTTGGNVPFWMRSMKYGSVPTDGISLSLIGGVTKDYDSANRSKLMDWGAGFENRVNAGNHSEFILIEAYAKIRLSIFELKGGRFREQIGLVDSTLSSGAFPLSGNSLGIPKIEAGIPNFWNVPLTNGVFAIKGNLAHGWMDTQKLNEVNGPVAVSENAAYLHQLSAYARIGKSKWKVKLYGGVNHFVVWGLEDYDYPDWGLSNFETFKYVVLGKPYGTNNIPSSKVGNHLGSVDQALEWKTEQLLFTGYHQFFYDVGALATLANAKDGLWGISLKNLKTKSKQSYWNKFLFEFLYSKSQGGEIDSKPRASGAEDYYNNFRYYNGWSYKGENLGNSLFTSKKYLKDGHPTTERQFFSNNRLIGLHGGAEFRMNNWYCTCLLSYSLNYGTYTTSPGERGLGSDIFYYDPPYFPKLTQFSAFFETHRKLQNGFELGIQLAVDEGELLNNSVGGGLTLTKRW